MCCSATSKLSEEVIIDDITSLPAQRSKEYLEALVALGGDLEAIEQERLAYDDEQRGSKSWGGPQPLRSNWGATFNGHGRCRRTTHSVEDPS